MPIAKQQASIIMEIRVTHKAQGIIFWMTPNALWNGVLLFKQAVHESLPVK